METWILENHWDRDITDEVLQLMSKINRDRYIYLYTLIFIGGVHALCGKLLLLGACLAPSPRTRLLLLPWLTLNMFFVVLTAAIFVSWAFLSFFVHILVAIFFPVVSGGLLGLWIYSWINVREWFIICGNQHVEDCIDFAKGKEHPYKMYRKLPAQSASPPPTAQSSEMRIVPNYMHHRHQVPV